MRQVKSAKARVRVDGSFFDTKATTLESFGDVAPEKLPGIVAVPRSRLRIRDVIPSRSVNQGSVTQYLKQTPSVGGAAPQTEGQLKSEADLTFNLDTVVYRTIAVWTSASRQALDDIEELRRVIDNELLYMLDSKVEEQILSGDGTGQNLPGLIIRAEDYDGGRDVAGDTHLDTISHALTQLEESDFTPTFIAVHPRDREKVRLIKTEEGGANKGQYVYTANGSSFWETPVVVTKSIEQSNFLVGDAIRGALILDRMENTIDISESHSDYFARNLIAIRAECRIALIVFRSDAWSTVNSDSALARS